MRPALLLPSGHCSPKFSSTRLMGDEYIKPHIQLACMQGNSKIKRLITCSPWTELDQLKLNWLRQSYLVRSGMAFCFCVENPRLNTGELRISYTVLPMNRFIDFLKYATIFSTFDAKCSYWQVEIVEQGQYKTEFMSHHGLSRCTRTLSRLKDSWEASQHF